MFPSMVAVAVTDFKKKKSRSDTAKGRKHTKESITLARDTRRRTRFLDVSKS